MGVPRFFCTYNGTEYSKGLFLDFCNNLGIHLEFTAPYTPQQNGSVESAISRAFMAGRMTHPRIRQRYLDVRFEDIRGFKKADWTSLWP